MQKTCVLVAAALFVQTAQSAFADVIASDDFTSGNPVSSSDYSLTSSGVFTTPGLYRVVSDPSTAFTNPYNSYFDHTLGTASGSMLFFDGANDASKRIWTRSVTLLGGASYHFSFWGSWASATGVSNAPVLTSDVDGVPFVSTLTTTADQWTAFNADFVAPTTGSYAFSVRDSKTGSDGNDGAVDDVLLTGPAVPEPATASILCALTTAALSRRRRMGLSK